MSEKLIDEIERRLNAKTIHDIRQIARAVGVPRPADGRKERITACILEIARGESDPAAPSVRGAHPKSMEYDRQLVNDIMRCRGIILSSKESAEPERQKLLVASGDGPLDFYAEGLIENDGERWVMHTVGNRGSIVTEVFVNEYFVGLFGLREGDLVGGKCKRNSPDEIAGLAEVVAVNGLTPSQEPRRKFENLSPVYPDRRLKVARGKDDVTGRTIDLLAPVGAGQRALVIAPHGAGKTALLKDIAHGLKQNNPQSKVILLLIDASPEEAADFRRAFPADVFSSAFDAGALAHVRTAKLALEYSKRLTESGKDVILILDDLTRLTRAYNSCGKQVTAALDTAALDSAKRFFAAARNAEEGGSLTIISALCSEGDALNEAIYSGLKDLCNMRISLSLNLARMRVSPPFDLVNTYTSGDERLLTAAQLKAAVRLRGEDYGGISKLIAQTSSETELCELLTR